MIWRAFTDGAGPTATGCGGAAARVFPPAWTCGQPAPVESYFHVCATTSQRMELSAVAEALDMTPPGAEVMLTTDSQYAYHAVIGDWKLKGNLDLIERLHRLAAERKVCMVWKPRNSEPDMKAVDWLSKQVAKFCTKNLTSAEDGASIVDERDAGSGVGSQLKAGGKQGQASRL